MGFEVWGRREKPSPSSSLFRDNTDLFSTKMHVSAEHSSHRPSRSGVAHVPAVSEHVRAGLAGAAMGRDLPGLLPLHPWAPLPYDLRRRVQEAGPKA